MTCSIYAELLLNLRQITICISTDPEHKLDTKLSLTCDNTSLEVHHGGQVSCIRLPAKISTAASLDTPAQRAQELSLRLPLAVPTQLVRAGRSRSFPLSAATLSRTAQLLCQACGSVLVHAGSIRQWKDLPHEDWAEMMDFWHCHKPEPPATKEKGGSSAAEKGYAASNRLTAQPGVGLVAVSSILLASEECRGMTVRFEIFSSLEFYSLTCLNQRSVSSIFFYCCSRRLDIKKAAALVRSRPPSNGTVTDTTVPYRVNFHCNAYVRATSVPSMSENGAVHGLLEAFDALARASQSVLHWRLSRPVMVRR